jgi:predicted signal transduction protein with EAL and GGDEF domain
MTETPGTPQGDKAQEAGVVGAAAEVVLALTQLVSDEVKLARAQLRQSFRRAAGAGAAIVLAAVLGLAGINLLAATAVAVLIQIGFSPVSATLAVGLLLTGLAFALVALAWFALRSAAQMPGKTLRSLRRTAETLGSMVKPGAENNSQT